jgi:GTP diphosphokinase / guanosine-3',5'-bis(diphosphate) 3'-diphosphatase
MSQQAEKPFPSVTAKSKAGGSVAAANASAASFASLMGKLTYLSSADVAQIRLAYRFADEVHLGQKRGNGEPYITHPIAVASQCAEWKLDSQALMAALLHDAMEDCGVTKIDLIERFGAPVAELVDGLTKLDKLQFSSREENQAESFRKMLLAMAQDVRVILIKLADRTHNMRTLGDVPRTKWARIAGETLEIYAPIAHRLGLNQTYRELQDLAFKYARPWRYATITKAVTKARNRRRDLVKKVEQDIFSAFQSAKIDVRISGREKTLFSIYKKMDEKHLSFAQVTDIYGFRIIVPTLYDCYTALGIVHQLYKPLPGKFKDHIAIPKVNGYQSLHTTVAGPSGVAVEFQFRTEEMHLVAESGVAAHWLYKASDAGQPEAVERAERSERLGAKWLQSLLDIQSETHDASEFWDHVKVDLFPDAVYVFTPKSKIMAMPRNATVIDFAYAVHTKVGNHAMAAKINGHQVPLRTELRNGDVVEVITAPVSHPNPAWLGFVRTGRARSKIRHYLKTMAHDQSLELGEKLLTQAVRAEGFAKLPPISDKTLWDKLLHFSGNKNYAELLVDIGLGKRVASILAKRLVTLLSARGEKPDAVLLTQTRFGATEAVAQTGLILDGSEGSMVGYSSCCRPIPGDKIVGYLGKGEGVAIHRQECNVAKRLLMRDRERFITVEWSDEPTRNFEAGVVVTVTNGQGVLARVAAVFADSETDIIHVDMGDELARDATDLRFLVRVRDAEHLNAVLRNLKRSNHVLSAERMSSR